ncbi:MAG: Fe-S cluster assembly ATPase SufC [Mycoplasmataceae bacterium]|jgi:Fe-S cluster assembly ATP-binding protein|nr:Fe-S cluster assembly ATPase SufC [Mycoplasmataceae bacterium]
MPALILENIDINIGDKRILNNINLKLEDRDVVALVGPNGVGKSTLLKAIMNHPSTIISRGNIELNGEKLVGLSTNKIAKKGIFYCPQDPPMLEGVQTLDFLKLIAKNSRESNDFSTSYKKIQSSLKELELPQEILLRDINVGFSGGQKKKLEILQSNLFVPKIMLLDEIDSGLDIDAVKIIAKHIKEIAKHTIIILISHHNEFISAVKPNKVVVLHNGTISEVGSSKIIKRIDKEGYKSFIK